MTKPNLETTSGRDLARLMGMEADEPTWTTEDLSAVLKHQLSAPLVDELREIKSDVGIPQDRADLTCFADLLHNEQPPASLLRLTKQLMKDRGAKAGALFPREVAAVLYVACICVSVLRCGEAVSMNEAKALKSRIQWSLSQPWLDEKTRELLELGRARLEK